MGELLVEVGSAGPTNLSEAQLPPLTPSSPSSSSPQTQVEVGRVGELLAEVGSAGGYGPTNLSEAQLETVLATVGRHMEERCAADLTLLRRRKVGGGW